MSLFKAITLVTSAYMYPGIILRAVPQNESHLFPLHVFLFILSNNLYSHNIPPPVA